MTNHLYMAIDAGQSHTEAVAVDANGEEVFSGNGGPSYVQDGSPLVAGAFDQALAVLDPSQREHVRCVLVGATGVDIPGRREALAAALGSRFPRAVVRVVGDAEFVLLGHAGDSAGGVLIAGTGSIAMGAWQGRRATAGGHGYLLGDEGGGAGLVLDALRRCLKYADSGLPGPPVAATLCEYFGVDDIRRVPGRLYAGQPLDVRRIAGAAPLIAAAAANGDHVAVAVLEQGGRELGTLAGRLGSALELPAGARFQLFLCGGVWRIRGALREAFLTALPPAIEWQPRTLESSPALAAARYARTLGPRTDSHL